MAVVNLQAHAVPSTIGISYSQDAYQTSEGRHRERRICASRTARRFPDFGGEAVGQGLLLLSKQREDLEENEVDRLWVLFAGPYFELSKVST